MEGEGFPPQRMKLKGSQAPGKAALVSTGAGGPTTGLVSTYFAFTKRGLLMGTAFNWFQLALHLTAEL